MSSSSSSKGGPDRVLDFRSFGERPAKGLATSLYIGGKADAKAEKLLRERGVKFILNCTPTRNLDPVAGCPNFFEGRTPPPFSYKRIPIFDNRGEDILQHMEAAVAFIEQSKHYGSVLVHCQKGVSRSASFVLGYLMKAGGMRLEAALAFLKEKRGVVQPNDSFMAQLQTYDARLEAQRTEARAKHERMFGPTTTSTAAATKAAATVAIGPARPPAAAAASIGPALPPHQQKGPAQQEAAGDGRGGKGGEGAVSIGPALPAHLHEEVKKKADEAAAPSAARAIGPTLPPHLQKPSPSPSPSAKKPIGPSLPPPPLAAPSRGGEGGGQKRPVIGPAMPPAKRAKD